jgi:hypothetical protein
MALWLFRGIWAGSEFRSQPDNVLVGRCQLLCAGQVGARFGQPADGTVGGRAVEEAWRGVRYAVRSRSDRGCHFWTAVI